MEVETRKSLTGIVKNDREQDRQIDNTLANLLGLNDTKENGRIKGI